MRQLEVYNCFMNMAAGEISQVFRLKKMKKVDNHFIKEID